MIFPGGDYARAMQEALDASRAEAERYAAERDAESPLEKDKCQLCRAYGQPMQEYGQPLSYLACVDLRACEARRKRNAYRD